MATLQRFTPRLYQQTIFSATTSKNTLVVLPTGLGKTAIAAMLAAHRLKQFPTEKIVFLAPTKPLAQQHLETFKGFFDKPAAAFALFTGHVKPEKRQALWEEATFIFSTPQGMENDLISRKLALDHTCLLIFDEAHRATGDYAYTYIADTYREQGLHERILALTASPGSDEATIKEVCTNLHIEDIEVRTSESPDVRDYVQDLNLDYEVVQLPEQHKKIIAYLKASYDQKISEAQTLGVLQLDASQLSKTTLLKVQGGLHAQLSQGEKSYEVMKTISLIAEALKVQHALELAETQTINALLSYLEGLEKQARTTKTKAMQNLAKDVNLRSARMLAERYKEEGLEHPKITRLKALITQSLITNKDAKIIVFTQFRDTATTIKEHLSDIVSAEIFVGQAKKGGTGLSQKQQKELIDRFKKNEFTVLIATSVAEEGLDIPSVDKVIFYEPIPSAIRTVQRRGRTGRHDAGNVSILVAQGTRDEGYRWSAHHKERRMIRTLQSFKKSFTPEKKQATIQDYDAPQEHLTITVDYREKGSGVMKALLAQKVQLDLKQLSVGDYQISDDIVIEYKNVRDFVDSIVDGRLLGQLSALRSIYKPILIIEGQEDLYAQRKINPAAIRGMLATIITSYHIPILRTSSPQDTAGVLIALAKRESPTEDRLHHQHQAKPWTEREQQEYLISALPGIGPKLAKPLLEHFGSVKAVMNASIVELQQIDLIGEKKATAIRELLDAAYKA